MAKLSEMKIVVLSAAAQRPEGIALPLPSGLRGGAAAKVVAALLTNGLLQEVGTEKYRDAPVWREAGDGHATTLVVTKAGLYALGIEPEEPHTAPVGVNDASTEEAAPDTSAETNAVPKARTPREGTKQATLIAMLRAPDGATIEEITVALEWAGHTVRGAMAGALKKKLGLEVNSEKVEGRGRVYRLSN
jgi:hypothetical protein